MLIGAIELNGRPYIFMQMVATEKWNWPAPNSLNGERQNGGRHAPRVR